MSNYVFRRHNYGRYVSELAHVCFNAGPPVSQEVLFLFGEEPFWTKEFTY